jgi:hypothetical protein
MQNKSEAEVQRSKRIGERRRNSSTALAHVPSIIMYLPTSETPLQLSFCICASSVSLLRKKTPSGRLERAVHAEMISAKPAPSSRISLDLLEAYAFVIRAVIAQLEAHDFFIRAFISSICARITPRHRSGKAVKEDACGHL